MKRFPKASLKLEGASIGQQRLSRMNSHSYIDGNGTFGFQKCLTKPSLSFAFSPNFISYNNISLPYKKIIISYKPLSFTKQNAPEIFGPWLSDPF